MERPEHKWPLEDGHGKTKLLCEHCGSEWAWKKLAGTWRWVHTKDGDYETHRHYAHNCPEPPLPFKSFVMQRQHRCPLKLRANYRFGYGPSYSGWGSVDECLWFDKFVRCERDVLACKIVGRLVALVQKVHRRRRYGDTDREMKTLHRFFNRIYDGEAFEAVTNIRVEWLSLKVGRWLQKQCREAPACPYKPILPESFLVLTEREWKWLIREEVENGIWRVVEPLWKQALIQDRQEKARKRAHNGLSYIQNETYVKKGFVENRPGA